MRPRSAAPPRGCSGGRGWRSARSPRRRRRRTPPRSRRRTGPRAPPAAGPPARSPRPAGTARTPRGGSTARSRRGPRRAPPGTPGPAGPPARNGSRRGPPSPRPAPCRTRPPGRGAGGARPSARCRTARPAGAGGGSRSSRGPWNSNGYRNAWPTSSSNGASSVATGRSMMPATHLGQEAPPDDGPGERHRPGVGRQAAQPGDDGVADRVRHGRVADRPTVGAAPRRAARPAAPRRGAGSRRCVSYTALHDLPRRRQAGSEDERRHEGRLVARQRPQACLLAEPLARAAGTRHSRWMEPSGSWSSRQAAEQQQAVVLRVPGELRR